MKNEHLRHGGKHKYQQDKLCLKHAKVKPQMTAFTSISVATYTRQNQRMPHMDWMNSSTSFMAMPFL